MIAWLVPCDEIRARARPSAVRSNIQWHLPIREITRRELYELVWSKPVTEVAVEFGVLDASIRKICRKHKVPTPPPGHWARLRAGNTNSG